MQRNPPRWVEKLDAAQVPAGPVYGYDRDGLFEDGVVFDRYRDRANTPA